MADVRGLSMDSDDDLEVTGMIITKETKAKIAKREKKERKRKKKEQEAEDAAAAAEEDRRTRERMRARREARRAAEHEQGIKDVAECVAESREAEQAPPLPKAKRKAKRKAPSKNAKAKRGAQQKLAPKLVAKTLQRGPASMQMQISAALAKQSPFATFDSFNAAGEKDDDDESNSEEEEGEEKPTNRTNDDGLRLKKKERMEWGPPPKALLSRIEVGDAPADFVAHFIRYFMGEWQRCLREGRRVELAETVAAATFNSTATLQETEGALTPLLRQLQDGELNPEVLKGLDTVVALAADREYADSIKEYVGITMGKKLWCQSMPVMMMQQNHGGALRKFVSQSAQTDFDKDPTMNAYMLALKRLITFAQCMRPPDEPSKRI